MSTRIAALQIKLENSKSISDLEAVLKEINNDLKGVDANSKAFTDLSNAAKKASGSLQSIKDDLRQVSNEKQIDSVAKLAGALSSGLAVATVAASHFGEQSQESINKAIRTATELTVVVSSIKPVLESLSSTNRKAFIAFVDGFKNSAIAATAFGTATRAAITATGIGLFIIALGTIVAYWDDISRAIGVADSASENYFQKQKSNLAESKRLLDEYIRSLDTQNQILAAQGDREQEIFDNKKEALLIQIEQAEKEKQIIADRIKAYREENNLTGENLKLRASVVKITGIKDPFIDRLKELKTEFDNASQASIQFRDQLRVLNAQETKFSNEESKKNADERQKQRQKEIDDLAKQLHESYQIELDEKKRFDEIELELDRLDGRNREQERKDSNDRILEGMSEAHRKEMEAAREASTQYLNVVKEKAEEELAIAAAAAEQRRAQLLEYVNAASSAYNQIATIFSDALARQLDSLNTQLDRVDRRYEESANNTRSLEALLADARGTAHDQLLSQLADQKKVEAKLLAERKRIENQIVATKNKQNQVEWKNSLINAIVQTAVSVAQALPNIPLSILVGALGAIQSGIIANNKPEPIPNVGYFDGGFTKGLGIKDRSGHEISGIVHANEYIIPERILFSQQGSQLVAALEAMRTGSKGYADGGFTPTITPDITSFNTLTSEQITKAIEKARPVVSVVEINEVQSRVRVIQDRTAA